MATPRLIDAFDPEVYSALVEKEINYRSALLNSGVIARNAEFDRLAGGASNSVIMPYLNELDGTAQVGSKDASDRGTVRAFSMGETIAQKDYLGDAWGISELDAQLAGIDNVVEVQAGKTGRYWERQFNKLFIQKVNGLLANNVASGGGDMIVNIAKDTSGAAVDADKISPSAVIDMEMSMGEHFGDIALYVFHTAVYGNLLKQEAHQFTAPSQVTPFVTYRGKPCVITNNLAPVQGTNRKTYTTLGLGFGAFQMGTAVGLGGRNVITRDEYAGNFQGAEDLISVQPGLILHPTGFTSQAAITGAKASPELAEYEKAGSWTRVFNREDIRIAALRTNG